MEPEAFVPSLLVSTDRLPPRERFEAWRDAFALKVARVDASTPDQANFRAEMQFQPLPKLTVSRNIVSACRLMRTPEMIRDGDDGLTFVICVEGRGDAVFGDQTVSLNSGQAMLVPHHRLGGIMVNTDAVTLSIRLDRDAAAEIFPSLDEAILRQSQPGDPTIKLLAAYCEQLMSSNGIPASLASLGSSHIRELMAHLYNPASELARAAPFSGVKAARLRSVLNEIARRFRDPAVNAARVGLELGLTGRYVQQLMDGVGLSFSEHVRNLRIDEAKRMLRDPRSSHMRISDVAYAVGFQDLSYFNREFRRRVGETPSDARRRR